jgi:hypothetical protein
MENAYALDKAARRNQMRRRTGRRRWGGELFPRRSELERCKRTPKDREPVMGEPSTIRLPRGDTHGASDSEGTARDLACGDG